MPGGKAYKPGDVLTAMSGKTIEIINTDAEGRLVLADGLHYAQQLGATHLINAATLTGAVAVALGQINAGVFTNNDDEYAHFTRAMDQSGERFWRLPIEDEYREQIVSQIGDIKNTGGRYGGAITAAMFLKEFAGDTPWMHLDIAGSPGTTMRSRGSRRGRRALGYAASPSGCVLTPEFRYFSDPWRRALVRLLPPRSVCGEMLEIVLRRARAAGSSLQLPSASC